MKSNPKLLSILSAVFAMLMLFGCSKSNQVTPSQQPTPNLTADGKHAYGLLTMTPDMYANVPVYSEAAFKTKFSEFTTTTTGTLTLTTPPVRDQGQIGSCTAFCGTEAREIMYNYNINLDNGTPLPVLSPACLYYEERVDILHERITADNGAYMIDIGEALQKYGICTEALYPYPSGDRTAAYKTPPSAAAVANALNYKISSAAVLINTGDVAAVKTCLLNHIPVMMGFNVYDNTSTYQYFENLNTNSYTYNPLTSTGALVSGVRLLGGHATPIIGYDDNRQAFKVQNSWGSAWGLNGFYYMPYSVFSSTKIVPQGGVYYTAN
jgi:C1A family cysteine protease